VFPCTFRLCTDNVTCLVVLLSIWIEMFNWRTPQLRFLPLILNSMYLEQICSRVGVVGVAIRRQVWQKRSCFSVQKWDMRFSFLHQNMQTGCRSYWASATSCSVPSGTSLHEVQRSALKLITDLHLEQWLRKRGFVPQLTLTPLLRVQCVTGHGP
jgi:hypothetical protein